MVCFKVLLVPLCGVTDGNHEYPLSGHSVPRSRFKPGTAQIQDRIITTSLNLLGLILEALFLYMPVWSSSRLNMEELNLPSSCYINK
jgi:hypothetical protein